MTQIFADLSVNVCKKMNLLETKKFPIPGVEPGFGG